MTRDEEMKGRGVQLVMRVELSSLRVGARESIAVGCNAEVEVEFGEIFSSQQFSLSAQGLVRDRAGTPLIRRILLVLLSVPWRALGCSGRAR
jgi:hypothetical protein